MGMKHHSHLLVRAILALWCTCAGLAPVLAHDGAHTPEMLVRVDAAAVSGHRVDVALTLTGLGGPLVLTGVATEGAQAQALAPVTVTFAADAPVQAVLDFAGPVPGIFTLVLEFGPIGQGAVVVIPSSDPDHGTH